MQPPSPPFHPRRIVLQLLTLALILVAVTTLASASASAESPYTVTETTTIGDLVIVDWQQTQEGEVVATGRTLIKLEDGEVADVMMLNPGDVAPQADAALVSAPAEPTGQYVIVDERGNAYVPEQSATTPAVAAAASTAQGWPNFDSTSFAA